MIKLLPLLNEIRISPYKLTGNWFLVDYIGGFMDMIDTDGRGFMDMIDTDGPKDLIVAEANKNLFMFYFDCKYYLIPQKYFKKIDKWNVPSAFDDTIDFQKQLDNGDYKILK